MKMTNVRNAVGADAEAVGAVHHQAWIETYTGLLPNGYLATRGIEKSVTTFQKSQCKNLAVAELDGKIIGFCGWGTFRDAVPYENMGEIQGIYLLKAYQRQGIGKRLMDHAIRALGTRGNQMAGLWVLATNANAIAFYEAYGFTDSGIRKKAVLGEEITERLYIKQMPQA